jgi:cellulose 1,4-beta-cellobiosidase
VGVDLLVPAHYTSQVMRSVEAVGGVTSALGGQLALASGIPTATWLDEIAALPKMRAALEQARRQQRATGVPTLPVFVVYDLPGRDCSAAASAGELEAGDLDRYENEFIAGIEALANEFPEVPKVFVLEPDSLPNVVTNMGRSKCRTVAEDYKMGIALAIRRLGPLGTIYVDVGWSGWIGTWSSSKMAQLLAEVLQMAGSAARFVRGFVTNTSNYGSVAAENAYASALRAALASQGITDMAYIVDTGRNGAGQSMGTWCNPRGAAMGPPPSANPGTAFADAYFWIKPPCAQALNTCGAGPEDTGPLSNVVSDRLCSSLLP